MNYRLKEHFNISIVNLSVRELNMCGIFFCYSKNTSTLDKYLDNKEDLIFEIMSRGPDFLGESIGKNYVASHTLLSITGYREQPVNTDRYMILFNGEIYDDYTEYNEDYSDTDYLTSFIEENENKNFGELTGEFAIVVYDKFENSLTLISDPFNTKPLYYQIVDETIIVATFDSIIKRFQLGNTPIRRLAPNQRIKFKLDKMSIDQCESNFLFNFGSQEKENYNDWNSAFEKSIIMRAKYTKHPIFVPMSSGHDSGLIVAELLQLGIPFNAYAFPLGEDLETLMARIDILNRKKINVKILEPSGDLVDQMREDLLKNVNAIHYKNPYFTEKSFTDTDFRKLGGTIAANYMYKLARNAGELIGLFGNGGDEIYCDYYYPPPSNNGWSTVNGDWRSQAGPWHNFQGGWNEVFLYGSERICSHNSIEGRYPLLDKKAVQEFLFLAPEKKGTPHKGPIANRLKELEFPIFKKKYGFSGVNV